MKYPSALRFQDFPVFNISQHFIKSLLLFICNNKGTIFMLAQHNHLTKGRIGFGYEVPRLNLSLEKKNVLSIADVLYQNVPPEIMNGESSSEDV